MPAKGNNNTVLTFSSSVLSVQVVPIIELHVSCQSLIDGTCHQVGQGHCLQIKVVQTQSNIPVSDKVHHHNVSILGNIQS